MHWMVPHLLDDVISMIQPWDHHESMDWMITHRLNGCEKHERGVRALWEHGFNNDSHPSRWHVTSTIWSWGHCKSKDWMITHNLDGMGKAWYGSGHGWRAGVWQSLTSWVQARYSQRTVVKEWIRELEHHSHPRWAMTSTNIHEKTVRVWSEWLFTC